VLVVTTSVWMLYGVHGNTTDLRPAVTLDGVLVEGTSGLQQRLIGTATSGNDTNLGTDGGRNSLLTSGRKSKLGGSLFLVVSDNDSVGTRGTGESTTISLLGFNVADNGSLGNGRQRQDVSAGQRGLLSAVDELSGVHTFGTDEQFIVTLVTVLVQELNLADRSTSARVVEDLLDGSSDVSLTFGVVQRSELDGTLAGTRVRSEDGGLTLPLCLLLFI
jgi:hypothetical protein